MKKILFILLFSAPFFVFGQCVQGDCENGVGTWIHDDGTITNGSWKNGAADGIVQEIMYDDQGWLMGIYDGEMKNGVIEGYGTETLYDEGYYFGTYVGNFKNNTYNGWGLFIYSDGTIEKGIFRDGELVQER